MEQHWMLSVFGYRLISDVEYQGHIEVIQQQFEEIKLLRAKLLELTNERHIVSDIYNEAKSKVKRTHKINACDLKIASD
jgi:hypothetical protein